MAGQRLWGLAKMGTRLEAWRRHVSLIPICMFVVALTIAGLAAFRLRNAHIEAWAVAAGQGRLLTTMLTTEIDRAVSSIALSLDAAAENLEEPGVAGLPDHLRNLVLFDRAAQAAGYGEIGIVDSAGRVTISSRGSLALQGLDVSHREYFRWHRDNPGAGLHIGKPIRTALGAWGIPVSRSRPTAGAGEGAFMGVVAGIIDISVWSGLVSHLQLRPDDEVMLYRTDGVLVLRSPRSLDPTASEVVAPPFLHGRDSADQYVSSGSADGVERLYTTVDVGGTGLMLSVGLSRAGIENAWQERAVVVVIATVAVLMLVIGATLVLMWENRRRRAAEASVRRSEAQLRMMAEHSSDVVSVVSIDGRREYVSPASRTLLGREPQDMVGESVLDAAHLDDRQAMLEAVHRLRTRQSEQEVMTYRATHACTGAEVWVESIVRPIIDPSSGTHEGCVAVARDITARKHHEMQLQVLAAIDGLTGIANRRRFDTTLAHDWERCRAEQEPLSIVLIDVDYFKRFNDKHGHQHGDACLREVAHCLNAAVRGKADLVARYGGEEFAVILPGTTEGGAMVVGERLRAAVEQLGIQHGDRPDGVPQVTISVGTATECPDGVWATSLDGMLMAADGALYDAKHAGRNRVQGRRRDHLCEEAGPR